MQEINTTETSVGADRQHALPTTRRRQGAKSLSPGKLFTQAAPSATQRGEPLARMGSAAGRLEEPISARASLPQ